MLIEFENVCFKYKKSSENVLNDISLKVADGEFIAIVGKNGAGKTTLIKHINGLLKPSSGKVKINGEDIIKTPISKMATIIGLAFQNPNHQLFAQTVKKELEFGPKNLGYQEEEREKTTEKIVKTFNIEHLLERSPMELSGGERRLVSIASVLTMNQQILVLDEPTFGQDYIQKKRLGDFLQALVKEGITVIIVSHDMDFILDFAPRTIVLVEGKIIADGITRDILMNESLLEQADLVPPILLSLSNSIRKFEPNFPLDISSEQVISNIRNLIQKKNNNSEGKIS
ncbi:MAG: energy-coupling factor ABC transporter ATP-binding protein [Candidatus Thorarchaeota archaeon]